MNGFFYQDDKKFSVWAEGWEGYAFGNCRSVLCRKVPGKKRERLDRICFIPEVRQTHGVLELWCLREHGIHFIGGKISPE